ncbi:Translation machinery-associated protein 16 [Cytospora mali]|uniref:Translation machinery-associated protein 16 n=1 Tax=Cytospora mali TaxID=578113 RepID=A0A194V343_CYTMA|nr:Translation machinery-associated protein 16 [Valsa mali var. pyri (nom. inval.)]
MPKTLEKTRKQIAKKRNGTIDALHIYSRDSKRLHKAQVRDERLEKLASVRKKHDQPLIHRISFFQKAARENEKAVFEMDKIQSLINQYVHQYDEEMDALRKTRRAGRPASAKEDLLKMKIDGLVKEQQNGFYLPDITKQANIDLLDRWEGAWSFLGSMSYVRISKDGTVKPTSFPPSSQ